MMWAWAHGRQEKRAAGIRCRPGSRAANDVTEDEAVWSVNDHAIGKPKPASVPAADALGVAPWVRVSVRLARTLGERATRTLGERATELSVWMSRGGELRRATGQGRLRQDSL